MISPRYKWLMLAQCRKCTVRFLRFANPIPPVEIDGNPLKGIIASGNFPFSKDRKGLAWLLPLICGPGDDPAGADI